MEQTLYYFAGVYIFLRRLSAMPMLHTTVRYDTVKVRIVNSCR